MQLFSVLEASAQKSLEVFLQGIKNLRLIIIDLSAYATLCSVVEIPQQEPPTLFHFIGIAPFGYSADQGTVTTSSFK